MKRKTMFVGILSVLLISSIIAGCGPKPGESLGDDDGLNRFVILERIDKNHYVIADKKNRFEYFLSRTYNGSYVIGGNVLDETGKPTKFEGEFPKSKE